MEEFGLSPQLKIGAAAMRFFPVGMWIGKGDLDNSGHFVRPVSIGQFSEMQGDVRTSLHVPLEVVGQLAARPPAKRVGVSRGDVERLGFAPELPWGVYVGVVQLLASSLAYFPLSLR